ncbi:MAG: hypothetical protein KGO92_02525 [Bacteroidota bacterium]|nr:hypothetical protein [Bacteroidota bacterium]
MTEQQKDFLQNNLVPLLQTLSPGQKGNWGKMDAQQMVEHLADIFRVANGAIVLPLMNKDPEKLAQARTFLMSDAFFQQNTRVPVMPEEPRPYGCASIQEAIQNMAYECDQVFTVYQSDPALTLMHPMFGPLDYTMQIHYLHKHIHHHLRQFGLVN